MGEQLVVKMVGQTTVLEGIITKQQKATEGRTQGVRPFSVLLRSPAPAGRRAARQRVQAFCLRQNLAPGRIHSAPAEMKSGAPGRREPDGAELRRRDRQAAGQVNSRKLPRAGHNVSGPFLVPGLWRGGLSAIMGENVCSSKEANLWQTIWRGSMTPSGRR